MYLDVIDEFIIVDFDFNDGDGLFPNIARLRARTKHRGIGWRT